MKTDLLDLLVRNAARHGFTFAASKPTAGDIIRAVKAMPYARASDRRPRTIIEEWRGTCSGKHYMLAAVMDELAVPVELTHRVYRLTREGAAQLFPAASRAIPEHGLTDVHTYASVCLQGERRLIDVTFPGEWDGRSEMPLACGPGLDVNVPPETDPQVLKEALIREHCIPEEREPFIAALSR